MTNKDWPWPPEKENESIWKLKLDDLLLKYDELQQKYDDVRRQMDALSGGRPWEKHLAVLPLCWRDNQLHICLRWQIGGRPYAFPYFVKMKSADLAAEIRHATDRIGVSSQRALAISPTLDLRTWEDTSLMIQIVTTAWFPADAVGLDGRMVFVPAEGDLRGKNGVEVFPREVNRIREAVEGVKSSIRLPFIVGSHDILDFGVRYAEIGNGLTLLSQLLPPSFSLSEIEVIVSSIVPEAVKDPSNFRKRLLATGWVVETGETRKDGAYRPARLFRMHVPKVRPLSAG